MTGGRILDNSFIHLDITIFHDGGFDGFPKGLEPVGGHGQPAGHGLARQVDLMAGFKDLLLTVEGKVVAVFANNNRGQQAGGGEAGVLQSSEGSDDGRGFRLVLPDVFAPDEVTAEKAAGGVVELLGDFLSDAAPSLRVPFYWFRINDFLDDWQVFRETGATGGFGRSEGVIGGAGLQRVTGGYHAGGVGFSRRRGRFFQSGQEEFQLRGVELFAFGSKDPAHEGVDFLFQQFHFLTQLRVLLPAGGKRSGQFGFTRSHA